MVTSSQHRHARRVEMHDKTDHRRRPTRQWLAIADMRSAIETGSEVKKCSLAVIGKVPTPASRIQVNQRVFVVINHFLLHSMTMIL